MTTPRRKRTYTTAFEAARTLGTLFSPEDFKWETELPLRARHVPLIIHISCNAHFTTFIAYIAQEILKKLDLEFAVVGGPENCCGSIQKNMGDPDLEGDVAAKAQLGFNRAKPRKVLSICPDCDDVFSEYPLRGRTFEHANISDLVVEYLDRLKPLMKPVDRRVVVHFHDVSPSRVKDTERVMTILGAIPGLTILPAKLAHGPGIHCQTVHPMPAADQAAMFDEAKALGADAVVVPYHSCYRQHIKMQLESGIETQHYFGLLAEALGIPFEEPFKRYRLTNDIEQVMSMLRPKIERLGYDEDLVRIYVDRAVFC